MLWAESNSLRNESLGAHQHGSHGGRQSLAEADGDRVEVAADAIHAHAQGGGGVIRGTKFYICNKLKANV